MEIQKQKAHSKYIIKFTVGVGNYEFYSAKGSYMCLGEKYKCITGNPKEAQIYSSYKRANASARQLTLTYINLFNTHYDIVEIQDGKGKIYE